MFKKLRFFGSVSLSLLLASPAFADPNFALDVQLFDDVDSCDDDGILDVGETGRAVVVLRNLSAQGFSDVAISVVPDEGTSVSWKEVVVPVLAPFGIAVAEFQLRLDSVQNSQTSLQVDVDFPHADVPVLSEHRVFPAHLDAAHGVSFKDDVELDITAWEVRRDERFASGWSRGLDEHGNRVWFVVGTEAGAHASLESPVMVPSSSERFVFSFSHRYQMCVPGEDPLEGGVIELSTDGGFTWRDITEFADFEYDKVLEGEDLVVLAGREVLTCRSPMLPQRNQVQIDFGTEFSGKTVQLRFRYAAGPGPRGAGWEIDDFEVSGVQSAPFDAYVPHRGLCQPLLAFASVRPQIAIHLPDDPQGDLQGFAVDDANLEPGGVVVAPVMHSAVDVESQVLVERMQPYVVANEVSPLGRIDGGQVVATGCSATGLSSMPFALLVLAGFGFAVRRRR